MSPLTLHGREVLFAAESLRLAQCQQVLSKSLLRICMKELSKCQLERGGEPTSLPWVSRLAKRLWVKHTQLFPEHSPG